MNINQALILTGTKNRNQLSAFLKIESSAVYQWDKNNLPETAKTTIYKAIGAYPNATELLKQRDLPGGQSQPH